MATQVTNYQCPACTGPLHFSSDSGRLQCDHCGESFEVAYIEQYYAAKEQAAAAAGTETSWENDLAGSEWSEEEAAHMRAYSCPSCGAQIVCDENTAATSCPYCDNPTVVPGQFTGMLRPDFVIPFKLDKEAAKAALKKYYRGKKLLPGSFSAENHIEELKGIYVPFWLFNGVSAANISYHATKSHSYRTGNQQVTVTEHYKLLRSGNVTFEKVPVDGSSKMPDAHMDAIEPFDYAGLAPFSTAYLPGFLADKYDVPAAECNARADKRIRVSTEDCFASTVKGYASVAAESSNIVINHGEVKYAMFPVWMLNTKWRNKSFLFAMNGQTGKLIGDLPVSPGKFLLWFACIAAPLMVVLGILMYGGGA
ncbi:MAG: Trm112 family protein [Clostridiales bacterium]|nr:Trm112 family protein [Clostridiales bacterium]